MILPRVDPSGPDSNLRSGSANGGRSLGADRTQIRVRAQEVDERIVPVCPALHDALVYHLAERGASDGPLFVDKTGERITVTSLRSLFQRVVRRAGLQGAGLTPRSLRDAYGARLAREGVAASTIAELMG